MINSHESSEMLRHQAYNLKHVKCILTNEGRPIHQSIRERQETDPFQKNETADLVTPNMSDFRVPQTVTNFRIHSASLGSEWAQSLTVLFPYI